MPDVGSSLAHRVDTTDLTRLLRDAGYAQATVISFTREQTGEMSRGGGSLNRFRLTLAPRAAPDALAPPASLILKETRSVPSQSRDPAYAHREWDCHRHGLFAGLSRRLHVPRVYATSAEAEAGRYYLWLEDLGDAFALPWTPHALAAAIRDLAELHAHWWGRDRELAQMPFLRQRAQAMYDGLWTERIAANCLAIESHVHQKAIARVFTPERCRLLQRLSQAVNLVYPHLEALPQTLLHQDIWLPNLGQSQGRTALIDWSYAGPGTAGVELSHAYALLTQMWGADVDDTALLEALYVGLTTDWGVPVTEEEIVAGYELGFCLRPAHALGGPVLGGILAGRMSMVGSEHLDEQLAAAEAVLQHIERGVRRLDHA